MHLIHIIVRITFKGEALRDNTEWEVFNFCWSIFEVSNTFVIHQHLQHLFTFPLSKEMISNPSYFAGAASWIHILDFGISLRRAAILNRGSEILNQWDFNEITDRTNSAQPMEYQNQQSCSQWWARFCRATSKPNVGWDEHTCATGRSMEHSR